MTRSFIISIHSAFFASSQFILPLPVVHTINSSGSLFVFLIDYWLNKVKINSKQTIGIIIGFLGAILATNSRLLIGIYADFNNKMKYFSNEFD